MSRILDASTIVKMVKALISQYERQSGVGGSEVQSTALNSGANHKVMQFTGSYLCIPSAANPRFILSRAPESLAAVGAIVKPTSLVSRLVWRCLLLMRRIRPIMKLMPSVSGDIATILKHYPKPTHVAANVLYIGASGIFQKYTVQFVDQNLTPKAYFKWAYLPDAMRKINREYEVLKRLGTLILPEFLIVPVVASELIRTASPVALGFFQISMVSQQTSCLKLQPSDKLVSRALESLYPEKTELISSIVDKGTLAEMDLTHQQALQHIFNRRVTLAFAHGDYSAWNRFLVNDKTYVIDWEDADFYPRGYDVVYFILHTEVLVENSPSADILEMILNNVEDALVDPVNPQVSGEITARENLIVILHLVLQKYTSVQDPDQRMVMALRELLALLATALR